MAKIDDLLHNYTRQVAMPWERKIAGAQRVWFAVYDKSDERRIRARIGDFELRTKALAQSYMAGGWKADAAMLAALADVRAADDVSAVRDAILTLYQPWLRETAERFQQLVPEALEHPAGSPVGSSPVREPAFSSPMACATMSGRNYERSWRCAAIPSMPAGTGVPCRP